MLGNTEDVAKNVKCKQKTKVIHTSTLNCSNWLSFCYRLIKGGLVMIANLNQPVATTFYKVREIQQTQPSTYKQRVLADRWAMALMLLAAIIFAILAT